MRSARFKIVKNALYITGISLVFASCSKPEAKFSANGKDFMGGDTVHLKNESTGAESFEWFLNEKSIGATPELSYVLDAKAKGPLVFALKAIDGEKNSTATQTLMAVTPLGTITAWSTFPGVEILQVNDQNEQAIGLTAAGFTADPVCGAEGGITLVLSPGTYTIDGTSSVTRSRRIVELQDNDCVSLKMH